MGAQGYEKVPSDEADVPPTPLTAHTLQSVPSSPPPSFRSRNSSPHSHRYAYRESAAPVVDQTLADTFDDGQGSDDEGGSPSDDRQRLIRGITSAQDGQNTREGVSVGAQETARGRANTVLPPTPVPSGRIRSGATPAVTSASSNDGVFANLNAKPERGEKDEEQPPSYEQAAADATPPYWETTILTPGMISDEVYVDGLPVGSVFSFVWNAIISMSFQLVGFLLTYLLHTTHAAKNGSRAGLGFTLVQYGFYVKANASAKKGSSQPQYSQPPDPNSHDFDPSVVSDTAAAAVAAVAHSQTSHSEIAGRTLFASEGIAYALMIVGWFILIKSATDYIKARRHEQLVLQSPDRGLNVPVVADGEAVESVV